MYKVHEITMPEDMQAKLLANYDLMGGIEEIPVVTEAKVWFRGAVSLLTERRLRDRVDVLRYAGTKPGGQTSNTDLHCDRLDDRQKFLLTVANNPRAGVILFDEYQLEHRIYRSEKLFWPNSDGGLLLLPNTLPELVWTQAPVGQLVSFSGEQMHTAPPQYPGDIKIRLSLEEEAGQY